ncbi:MAG: hypothetical protein QM535_18025 [Limnohabitans sp.]|nr:hypothetical protein [Limnohabitans sp.]
MLTYFLFKNIRVFNEKNIDFTLSFPLGIWKYRKINKNEFCFLKKNTNSAIIMTIFNDKSYNYDDLKENEYFVETKLGDYLAYVTCKLFEDKMLLQYEWYLVIAVKKIVFYYSMMDNLSDLEKDSQYNEVLKILNTIVKKS